MFNPWHDIHHSRITPEEFLTVIEISQGSSKKYELDKDTGMIILDRILSSAVHYPMNYGFIPRTYCEDNDPLDVLVLCSQPLDPATLVSCIPIGALQMIDNGEKDEKIIAIAAHDPYYNTYTNITEIPSHYIHAVIQFFRTYKQLEKKSDIIINDELLLAHEARALIAQSIQLYHNTFVTA